MYEKTFVVSSFAIKKNDKVDSVVREDLKETENNIQHQIKYLGKNGKNILVLVNEKDHIFLEDDELSFLMKVLSACGINMADVALVNIFTDSNISNQTLTNQFAPAIILFIGTEPQAIGFPIQIPMYQVQSYNKQQYLCTPSLQKLAGDKEEKKLLWNTLKKIFSIA
ncbi:MAG: hypothetical protein ACKVOM_04130 [Ferruginibacter sp.]